MLYLANPTGDIAVHDAMRAGRLGFIATPAQGNVLIPGVAWCADNGCFGRGYPGDNGWLNWLERLTSHAGACLFATAPDVVGDARASLPRSMEFLPKIRELGYPAALVAQDGLEDMEIPWGEFDCFFVGGTTDWKLSESARLLAIEARERGKRVHMGRVNSRKRMRYANPFVDSVDGTFLAFGPRINLPRLLRWLEEIEQEIPLYPAPAKYH